MAVQYQDYYQTLGVERGADEKEIQRAYRKLARQFHPDVNKAPDAEARFKQINEAYEVLKDPEKRKRYDQLGANWQAGQEFTPPPGFEGQHVEFDFGPGGEAFDFGGDFSSFFEQLFGNVGGRRTHSRQQRARRGQTHEAVIELPLEELVHGGSREITLQSIERDAEGRPQRTQRSYDVRIPPGTTQGTTIRLAGQGSPGSAGGPPGDLLLRVHLVPHERFEVEGFDLSTRLAITPSEGALGARIDVPLLAGQASVTVPPGSSSGRKLRLRGQGLPLRDGSRGDLYVELVVMVPSQLTPRERELYEALSRESQFHPRG